MGSRAGIIVKGFDGDVELFYDHWAAQTLAQDAALAGFASTLARVRTMDSMGVPSVQEWTSATWMEGAMLIDIPRRRVAWAEEGEGLVLPRIANRLIEETWPGWTAVWSPEGVQGIIHLAGTDPESLFCDLRVERRLSLADHRWFLPGGGRDWTFGEPLSVRLDDGEVVLWRADAALQEIACFGPEDILGVARRARDERAAGPGWGDLVLLDEHGGAQTWADRGVHVDVPTRTVCWWSTSEETLGDREFAACWPGWTVRALGDDHEWHEHRIGVPLARPWAEHVADVRAHFESLHAEGPRQNPVTRLARVLAADGHDITPLPGAIEFVPSTGFSGATAILDVLDHFARGEALPPARYVDRYGAINE